MADLPACVSGRESAPDRGAVESLHGSPLRHPRVRLPRQKRFYLEELRPLGYVCFYEAEGVAEFGHESYEFPTLSLHAGPPTQRLHVAFAAADEDIVRVFYAAALAAGGRDNGPPGRRAHYRAFCAYALDPDGNNIEALVKDR